MFRESIGMIRCILVLVLSLLYFSPVHASLDRRERPSKYKHIPLKVVSSWTSASANSDFHITAATEVRLDDRPCRFDQVPDNAIIILLEIASNESKEIVRIHFRTSRQPALPVTSK